MGEIFISHSSADQAAAATVAEALRQGGHNVFLDSDRQDGISPGDVWSRTLFHKLRLCDAVVLLNSTASQGSKRCHTELAVAGDLGSGPIGWTWLPGSKPTPASSLCTASGLALRWTKASRSC